LWKLHKLNKCRKLFITYQCYNRSCKKVISETKFCSWEQGYKACLKHARKICVWKSHGRCKQYRTDCEINYFYSLKIYRTAQQFQEWNYTTGRWHFW
jgi:hypothetical protein